MGNDGGSIPRRIELVKEKAKDVKINPDLERIAAWFYCALSKQPLQPPVVACPFGKLYNQDAVIEYLLDKKAYGDGDKICSHITSPKDTFLLKLTPNPAYKESASGNGATTMGHLEKDLQCGFICPVSMKEMNGKHRFVYLNTCGCVYAEQALKEIKSKECVVCGKPFEQENIIVINPTKEELEPIKKAYEIKKANEKAEKKAKKAAKAAAKQANGQVSENSEKSKKREAPASQQQLHPSKKAHVSSSAAITVMDKVAQELAAKNKNKERSEAIKSIYEKKQVKGNYLTMGTFNRYA